MKPSKYQEALYSWIGNGKGNAIVNAVAGSGKTTSALECVRRIPTNQSVLFLAFNKSIATELQQRVPSHCKAMTLNSLGHRTVMRHFNKRVNLNSDKTSDIIKRKFTEKDAFRFGPMVRKLVGLAKAYGIAPAFPNVKGLMEDTIENWEKLMNHFDLEAPRDEDGVEEMDRLIELVRKTLSVGIGITSEIDFDDQLYLPIIFGASPPKFDWIFVDETQDLSPVQQALVVSTIKRGGRVVAVGDPNQSIYGFRGADVNSMPNFQKTLKAVSLDLSICYRCPKSHVELANKLVPQIEAAENAPEGEILDLGFKWEAKVLRSTDLVVCRYTAPLIKTAYKILSQKIAVKVLGRDIGAGLIKIIENLKAKDLETLQTKLYRWRDRKIKKIRDKDPDGRTDTVEDMVGAIEIFIEMADTPDGVCKEIRNLYTNKRDDKILTLSTVHKAKGLQAERVFIINVEDMPSKAAKKDWAIQQEYNIKYVALTRATKTLGFISVGDDR